MASGMNLKLNLTHCWFGSLWGVTTAVILSLSLCEKTHEKIPYWFHSVYMEYNKWSFEIRSGLSCWLAHIFERMILPQKALPTVMTELLPHTCSAVLHWRNSLRARRLLDMQSCKLTYAKLTTENSAGILLPANVGYSLFFNKSPNLSGNPANIVHCFISKQHRLYNVY